jgi:hypothetical protein
MHLRFAAAVGPFPHLPVGALANGDSTTWIMLDVSPEQYPADCHLLRMAHGTNILVDIADAADAPTSPHPRRRGPVCGMSASCCQANRSSDKFQLPRAKKHHAQKQPTVAPALDICRSVGSVPVSHREIRDLKAQLGGTE